MLVAPSEPAVLRELGETSSLPETYGCDFLFLSGRGIVGCQRKEVKDLVASLADGRMATLLDKMSAPEVTAGVMLVEGSWWWELGEAPPKHGHFGAPQWRGFEVSIQMQGLILVRTKSLSQTATRLPELETYFEHGSTDSLLRVPKRRGVPGKLRPLMAFDGMSLVRARAVDEAGIGLLWSCSETEMADVPVNGRRMGKALAAKLGAHIRYREGP